MFKNCCGCPGKKTSRKQSLNDEEEEERREKEEPVMVVTVAEAKQPEPTAKEFAQSDVATKEEGTVSEIAAPRKTSLKKPRPRLSISTEVKIIPSNFEDGLEEEEEEEVEATTEPDHAEEEDLEEVKIVVKNIDGKMIKKSDTEEGGGVKETERPSSPLSDEVFVVSQEQPGLELPLHNLGVRLEVAEQHALACGLDIPLSPRGNLPTPHPVKRSSMPALLPQWLSEDDDETGGTHEPPATPVAKDELALRRHRFFSELLSAAQAANEHRVRFDPLGPTVAKLTELETTAAHHKELENLLDRLEKITARLEKAVPVIEHNLAPFANEFVVTKSLEDLLDEHLTPTEKKSIGLLINTSLEAKEKTEEAIVISPDSSADIEDLSDRDKAVNDSSDNSTNSQDTVVKPLTNGYKNQDTMTNSQSTLSMSAQGYQDIVQGPFAAYLQLSTKIGGDVAEQAKLVQQAFQAQLQYLSLTSQRGKPSVNEEVKLLHPTSQYIQAIQEFREKHRTSQFFNHLSAVSESIPALGWVTVSPAPSPFVKEMNDAGQFYTNRVLKEWKEKDRNHVEWTKAWVQTLTELQTFVKKHHITGLVWTGTGGGAPPPPPAGLPPPPPMLDLADLTLGDASDDRSALFAEINRGADITKSLKRVTDDMQTHKNPNLRSGPAPFKAPSSGVANQTQKSVSAAGAATKPPNFVKDGKKWIIEYQQGNHQLVVDGAEMNNVVYVFKCTDSTITVKGKLNSIFLDSCKKTAVVFDSVVSSVEFVNCQSVQMQVLGKVPTISIDKTDGCQMYLSDQSLDTEVIHSKSSEMNVLVPKGNGDFTEFPVPEQFKTKISRKGLTTVALESQG